MLSTIARHFAAEILNHDWSDAPYRKDRAGHQRRFDTKAPTEVLTEGQTVSVKLNVVWVTAQVLASNDPNFDVHEFAVACGIPHGLTHNRDGSLSGTISAGIRGFKGREAPGGTWIGDLLTPVEPSKTNVIAGAALGGAKTHALNPSGQLLCGAKGSDGSDPFDLSGPGRDTGLPFEAADPTSCLHCAAKWTKLAP